MRCGVTAFNAGTFELAECSICGFATALQPVTNITVAATR